MGQRIDGRRTPRYATRIAARLLVDRRAIAIDIVDISRHGACARGRGMPPRGTEVVIVVAGMEAVATVVWSDRQAGGFNFHREIDPQSLLGDAFDLPHAATAASALTMRP